MSPIASRARSKRRMRPKRRKKPPAKLIWREGRLEMRLGEGGGNGRRVWVKELIWGDLWGFFWRRGSVPTACAECYADFWRERVSILYVL